MKFKDMPYERPNIDKVIGYIKATKENLENSSSAEEQINLIKDFADFRKDFDTTTSIAHVRHTMNTLDEFYAKENEFLMKIFQLLKLT